MLYLQKNIAKTQIIYVKKYFFVSIGESFVNSVIVFVYLVVLAKL